MACTFLTMLLYNERFHKSMSPINERVTNGFWAAVLACRECFMQVPAMVRRITNDIRSATTIQELEAIFSVWQTYNFFDSIHTAATFTRAANLLKGRPASTTAAAKTLLDQLAAAWDTQLQQATVQGLANVLWASGRLRYANPQLWSRTLQLFCRQQQGEATCQEVSNVVYSWQCWQKQMAVKFLAEAVRMWQQHLVL